MYIFGGYSSVGDVHFNDLREFNPQNNEWRLMNPSCGIEHCPSPRRRQCTVVVGDKVFLFGGTMQENNFFIYLFIFVYLGLVNRKNQTEV